MEDWLIYVSYVLSQSNILILQNKETEWLTFHTQCFCIIFSKENQPLKSTIYDLIKNDNYQRSNTETYG